MSVGWSKPGGEFDVDELAVARAHAAVGVNVFHRASDQGRPVHHGRIALDEEPMNRRLRIQVTTGPDCYLYAYARDILLRSCGVSQRTVSDRQWRDVLGLLLVQGGARPYIRTAPSVSVSPTPSPGGSHPLGGPVRDELAPSLSALPAGRLRHHPLISACSTDAHRRGRRGTRTPDIDRFGRRALLCSRTRKKDRWSLAPGISERLLLREV